MPWRIWKPELNCERTLAEVLATMPRDHPDKVPWQIRLLENPESRFALPGAVNLFAHDCIHALLCTSFYSECEAWTIGFTMGTADDFRPWHAKLLKLWSRTYPGTYKMCRVDRQHFDEGLAYGQRSECPDLTKVPFRSPHYLNKKMKDIRKEFGLHWIDAQEEYQRWAMKRWNDKPLMGECPSILDRLGPFDTVLPGAV